MSKNDKKITSIKLKEKIKLNPKIDLKLNTITTPRTKKVVMMVNPNAVAAPGSIAEIVVALNKEKRKNKKDILFENIVNKIDPLIKRIVGKFNIPGYEKSDLYQEALYALRFKAVSDFDVRRIIGDDFVGFEKFAALCVKRHLSTLLKCSFQNKKATLNTSVSFNSTKPNNESFDISSLINSSDISQESDSENKEMFKNIISNLMSQLSDFEKKVLALYSQRFSYEEICDLLNIGKKSIPINIKGVDNALSRIKVKARSVIKYLDIKPF